MIYWWQKKPEFKKLAKEVRLLFLKNSIVPPQDILPQCMIPGDTAENIFITMLRMKIRSQTVRKNYTVDKKGEVIIPLPEYFFETYPAGTDKPERIIVVNYEKQEELFNLYKNKGIDLKLGVRK